MTPNRLCIPLFAAAASLAMFAQEPAAPAPAAPAAAAQPAKPPAPPLPPTVYVNPRSGPDDPRIGLKAGLYDAGEAAFGMERISSLHKPPGFSPEDNATAKTANLSTPGRGGAAAGAAPGAEGPPPGAAGPGRGAPAIPASTIPLGSTNSDLAFSGNHMFAGNYNGVNFYDIDSPSQVKLRASLLCPGGQGDVSVYGHLLFMSAEAMNARNDCGAQGIPLPEGYVPPPPPTGAAAGPGRGRPVPPPSPDRFRGVRIFDISDLSNPKQVAAVQACRGSHTHTLVVDKKDKDNVYIYISGTGGVRQEQEMPGCTGGDPDKNPDTALFRIDIVKVPLAHPEQAKIVNSPRIFADSQSGVFNGLWKGGTHGEGTQTTSATNQCHDITVFADLGLAAGACSGNGIILDISNPAKPVRIAAVADPNYAFWHSANFSNDGTKVLFTDEWGGGGQARCRASDPMHWGADAIYTLENRKLTLASYYKMPAPQTELENCVAHNGSLVPVPGRDIFVQSWYQGGISVMDFTDATHPFEIGYFDRGPLDGTKRAGGGHWSTYWYNGYVYSSEMARGVDVLKLIPSKYLTQNEIDAANQIHFDELNVQNQPKLVWPSNFTVAKAYLDQLARGTSVTAQRLTAISQGIAKVEAGDKKQAAQLKTMGQALEKDSAAVKNAADKTRMKALAAILLHS